MVEAVACADDGVGAGLGIAPGERGEASDAFGIKPMIFDGCSGGG